MREAGERVVLLRDLEHHTLLARIDADTLFALRASLVAAVAADALAPPDAKRVAVLGGGQAGSTALKALRLVRSLREVALVAPTIAQAVLEAAQLQLQLKTPVRAVESGVEALDRAELVLLTGGVPLPPVVLWPSVHLSVPNVGHFDASPVPAGVLAKAWRVSDGPEAVWGHPVQLLGPVLSGEAPRPDGLTPLFLGAEPASLDLLAAWHVYLGAREDKALPRLDLEP